MALSARAVDWEFWAGVVAACFLSWGRKTETKGPLSSTIKGNARLVIRQTFALVSWSY